MKILFVGECSYLHNTLKRGLEELGHKVLIVSDGNGWHNSPRDIDLRRPERWGKLGGLWVLWSLLKSLPQLCGNDIVQLSGYTFIPLKARWNRWLFLLLRLLNRRVVKGCFSDDPQLFLMQSHGVPTYSDTYWNGREQNVEANRQRIAEHMRSQYKSCWHTVSYGADALVACLYEYYLCYDTNKFHNRLHYIPLPMEIPNTIAKVKNSKCYVYHKSNNTQPIKVLVGIQPKRDYLKGAKRIASFVESVALRHPGRIEIEYVEGVPYDEYMHMLDEADVLVDQLYSYTPSMNSLAAMARGTVVIGGGEDEYYDFIGEPQLRPIINVRPDVSDSENEAAIEQAFFTEGKLQLISHQSIEFVRKHHDYRHVAELYERLYSSL